MKKLRDRSGETLVETLVSLLIITLSLAFLSTSLVTASQINKKLQGVDTSMTYEELTAVTGTVELDGNELQGVSFYEKDGYCFYTSEAAE